MHYSIMTHAQVANSRQRMYRPVGPVSKRCVGGVEALSHIIVVRDGEVENTSNRHCCQTPTARLNHCVCIKHQVGDRLHLVRYTT